jgi:hypothetical protein
MSQSTIREWPSGVQSAFSQLLAAFQSVPQPNPESFDYGGDLRREDIDLLLSTHWTKLDPSDVSWYVQSFDRMGATVPDFKYFFPTILATWARLLLKNDERSALFENLPAALARTQFIVSCLSEDQEQAVYRFMRETLLERISTEQSLRIVGFQWQTYRWFFEFTGYGVIGRDMAALWTALWKLSCEGHAISVVQYSSCLICEDGDNPVFAPWTREAGGGVPTLWGTDSIGIGECWQPANVEFVRRTLSPSLLRERLHACASVLTLPEHKSVLEHLHLAMEVDPDLVSLRCSKLPDLLASPSKVGGFGWATVGAR